MTKEQTIKTMRDVIKGLNDLTIVNGNNRKLVEDFNKATDMLERKLSELLNSEQEAQERDATKADQGTGGREQ